MIILDNWGVKWQKKKNTNILVLTDFYKLLIQNMKMNY
jgi:hypothetical protein